MMEYWVLAYGSERQLGCWSSGKIIVNMGENISNNKNPPL
jgi:hypothetical protein